MQRSVLKGPPTLVSANGAFGSAKRRFPPEFRRQIATLAMQVFESGLLERFGVVTSLCCLELNRPENGLLLKGLLLKGLLLKGLESPRAKAFCRAPLTKV